MEIEIAAVPHPKREKPEEERATSGPLQLWLEARTLRYACRSIRPPSSHASHLGLDLVRDELALSSFCWFSLLKCQVFIYDISNRNVQSTTRGHCMHQTTPTDRENPMSAALMDLGEGEGGADVGAKSKSSFFSAAAPITR